MYMVFASVQYFNTANNLQCKFKTCFINYQFKNINNNTVYN